MTSPHSTLWQQDAKACAQRALACLDLTSLNDNDTERDIARLCERAQTPFGAVAAVCVWPRLAAFARSQLPDHIAVAAVANFPDGSDDAQRAVADTQAIVQSGAQEVDVVLPYARLQAGDLRAVSNLLTAVRKASANLRLKVILETGELVDPTLIAQASRISLECGADFLKTSTGKTPVSATTEAARTMLTCIADWPDAAHRVGLKPSGGIRTVADAAIYMDLFVDHLGAQALTPQRFRIGASGILSDIESILSGRATANTGPSGTY